MLISEYEDEYGELIREKQFILGIADDSIRLLWMIALKSILKKSRFWEVIYYLSCSRIEGLLTQPLFKDFNIDLNRIKGRFEVKGDWFPFEIKIGEFVFALDDDGSIFTSTENFPEPVFKDAYEHLHKIAHTTYIQR